MTGTVRILAAAGLVLCPDIATAFGWRTNYCPPPPIIYAPPEIVFLPPCVPIVPYYGPRYEPQTNGVPFAVPTPAAPPANPPKVMEIPPEKPTPPKPDLQRIDPPKLDPVGGGRTENPTTIPKLDVPAMPSKTAPAKGPGAAPFEIPKFEEVPKATTPKLPPVTGEPIVPVLPKLDLQLPPPTVPPPSVAPAQFAQPTVPDFKAPELDGLSSTSRYLSRETAPRPQSIRATLVPVVGNVPAGKNRLFTVGVYNYTASELALTFDGRAVKLPARSWVQVEVPQEFRWRVGNETEQTSTIPPDAASLELLLNSPAKDTP